MHDHRPIVKAGEPLPVTRPNPHEWDVPSHPDTVRVRYRIFGDRADGTYLQIDPTHAHMNAPATFLWARGELFDRPVRVSFVAPEGADWTVATQLYPTDDPTTFTAPNTRYLMDSPIEFGATRIWEFSFDDGQTGRVALHHTGSDRDALAFLQGVEAIVAEEKAVFGEYPRFDGGTYTFIADYLPWADGDGMEHRNSTILTSRASLDRARVGLLGTVAHEFFHCWNVERIRPRSLEPFDFERANMSSELWLAEGFTSYYGNLILHRAGIAPRARLLGTLGNYVNAVRQSPGVRFRSAVDMSRLAPFVDAARPVDPTYWDNTFLSYYTYGAAIALGLDLELRARSEGALTLDEFMRAMWRRFGKAEGATPPAVPRPYDVAGAEAVLAEVSGDPVFAREFFARHVTGTEVIDYGALLAHAGLALQPALPGLAYFGAAFEERQGILYIGANTQFGTPAYEAGLERGDAILTLDGARLNSVQRLQSELRRHEPGELVTVRYRRRDGYEGETTLRLAANPIVQIVPLEEAGAQPTAEQLAFREAWLGSRR